MFVKIGLRCCCLSVGCVTVLIWLGLIVFELCVGCVVDWLMWFVDLLL